MKKLSFTLFILSFALCIYSAIMNSMIALVWALNAIINFSNYNEFNK